MSQKIKTLDRSMLFESLVQQKQMSYTTYKSAQINYIRMFAIGNDGSLQINGDSRWAMDNVKVAHEAFIEDSKRLDDFKRLDSSGATDNEILTFLMGTYGVNNDTE